MKGELGKPPFDRYFLKQSQEISKISLQAYFLMAWPIDKRNTVKIKRIIKYTSMLLAKSLVNLVFEEARCT